VVTGKVIRSIGEGYAEAATIVDLAAVRPRNFCPQTAALTPLDAGLQHPPPIYYA
jgi:hypothetical protein